ncbi:MAG: CDP-glucose 4,6-dehydratase [Kiloniellales bacterium]|nr:CDP-glucose 4,6-dehydratase [Kiloniellales bacterium]
MTPDFWRGRRVLLTGHTGFKGAWLALWLESLGAEVTALALAPATEPNLFDVLSPWTKLDSLIGDIRAPEAASAALSRARPEVVFHLAAQSLVRPSYVDPIGTFATNVLGTVHLLDAVRRTPSVRVVVVVTSDKVYANDGRGQPFREGDPFGGGDPYSASKAAQEIATASYRTSFFQDGSAAIVSARAGNVIGGGDWATDRLVPDFVRAVGAGVSVAIRHPDATRPWQHVLDPLAGYLRYAERICAGDDPPKALNFGPDTADVRPVRWVVDRLVKRWGDGSGWRQDGTETPPEAAALMLDAGLAIRTLGWRPRLRLEQAIDWTVAWYRACEGGGDMRAYSLNEIQRYQELA